jgi:hypothetical protein
MKLVIGSPPPSRLTPLPVIVLLYGPLQVFVPFDIFSPLLSISTRTQDLGQLPLLLEAGSFPSCYLRFRAFFNKRRAVG